MRLKRIRELVTKLNNYRNSYYNKSISMVSDYEYDKLFDELSELEEKTGYVLANSPTQEVGYEVKNELGKQQHKYPMLSLDKTKSINKIMEFSKDKDALLMLKMDGLTCCVTYDKNGNMELCETRGNGEVGLNITHNAKTFVNMPLKIKHKGGLVVFGEAIIDYPTFYKINESLPETNQYKNPRNLCSGSVQQLDSKICAERGVKFIAWRLVFGLDNNSFKERLEYLEQLGFEVVPFIEMSKDISKVELDVELARENAAALGYPIDGLVCGYDDVSYGESLGATSHHLRSQIAFKYGEDREFSILRKVEWNPSRTGQINPVAIFDTITLADTEVSRASLHNLSVMEKLNVKIGAKVEVSKRNEIIPCIESCDGKGEDIKIPETCPICGSQTEIRKDGISMFLYCTSDNCEAKLLSRLELFVGKDAFDIKGLSSATIQYFINLKWINNIQDVFMLYRFKTQMKELPGFGKKSVDNLLDAIENSKEITLAAFIRSLGINMIGRTQSKAIAKYCNNSEKEFIDKILNNVDFSKELDGFGEKMNSELYNWFEKNMEEYRILAGIITIKNEKADGSKDKLKGMSFAITGKLNHFANRDELIKTIEVNGGKYTSSVSAKTNFLINNDKESSSSKNLKMIKLGGKIINENDFIRLLEE